MRRYFLFIFLFLSLSLFGFPCHVLQDSNGAPSPALLEILKTFDVPHNGSWPSILEATQKNWKRKPGTERWNLEIKKDPHPEKTYALFSKLYMTPEIDPTGQEFQYAIILGATVQRVHLRLSFLKKQWLQGIRFKEIVFLTGDRALDPSFESREILKVPQGMPTPKNETEMMIFVFNQMDLPEELKKLPLHVIDTPKRVGQTRPDTKDTILFWLSQNPQPGTALMVSDQPFIARADLLAKSYLPCFSVDAVGKSVSFEEYKKNERGLSILLDELASWIYEEVKMCNGAS